jgi:hypothetical protein
LTVNVALAPFLLLEVNLNPGVKFVDKVPSLLILTAVVAPSTVETETNGFNVPVIVWLAEVAALAAEVHPAINIPSARANTVLFILISSLLSLN